MIKYSTNAKLNNILNSIREDILCMCDHEDESISQMFRYMKEFPRESDFNLVQYGNLIAYYDQVRNAYYDAGYSKTGVIGRMSDSQLWDTYKRQVGWVARKLAKEINEAGY